MRAIAVFSPTRHAGKSWFATALCRVLVREGWQVAPFQSQAEVTKGYQISQDVEISFASAWQAWAANIPVASNLNPVVLRRQESPSLQYQLYIQGRGIGTVGRSDYYQNYYCIAKPLIYECLEQLQQQYELLVFDAYRYGLFNPMHEDTDENFDLLHHSSLHPAGVIVVNCEIGGELNQLWGLWQRLSEENRNMIRGIIFNQWHGDRRLSDLETRWVKTNLNRPVLGYLPSLSSHFYNPESPLTFGNDPDHTPQHQLRIQILRLPHLSGYEDFDPLSSEPSVNLSYFDPADQLGYPDAVIVPHTTAAIADLEFLRKYNCPQQLQSYAAAGGTILGIGDGATLLAKQITHDATITTGMGLTPFNCEFKPKSPPTPCQTLSDDPFPNLPITGMEFHQGKLNYSAKSGFSQLFTTKDLGYINQGKNIWVIYLQGLFNNGPWRRFWLNYLRQKRGLSSLPTGIADFTERREAIIDALANHVEQYIDIAPLLTDYDY